jgi:hypothetical protein
LKFVNKGTYEKKFDGKDLRADWRMERWCREGQQEDAKLWVAFTIIAYRKNIRQATLWICLNLAIGLCHFLQVTQSAVLSLNLDETFHMSQNFDLSLNFRNRKAQKDLLMFVTFEAPHVRGSQFPRLGER